jgi:hypothetical protein
VRAALALIIVPLVGCSQVLGIQDPSTGDDGGRPDGGGGPTDAPPSGDHLELSLTNPTIAQGQRVRFQVFRVPPSGQKSDVTGDAGLSLTLDGDQNGTLGQDDTARLFDATKTGNTTLRVALSGVSPVSTLIAVTMFTCHPVINELQTGGTAGAGDEFVEIFNPCAAVQPVAGWTLNYRAAATTGATDDNLLITLAGTMAIGEVRLYVSPGYSGTTPTPTAAWVSGGLADKGGSVGLRDATTNPKIVDSVGYGTAANPFVEGMAAVAPPAGQSIVRGPFDGRDNGIGAVDGDNKSDFTVAAAPSPGALNF